MRLEQVRKDVYNKPPLHTANLQATTTINLLYIMWFSNIMLSSIKNYFFRNYRTRYDKFNFASNKRN